VPAKDVSPILCSDPEPAMGMDDQTMPTSPVGVDPLDEPPPLTTTDSELATSSPCFVVPRRYRLLRLFRIHHRVWIF